MSRNGPLTDNEMKLRQEQAERQRMICARSPEHRAVLRVLEAAERLADEIRADNRTDWEQEELVRAVDELRAATEMPGEAKEGT